MAEEKKAKLTDEELDKVAGGSSGDCRKLTNDWGIDASSATVKQQAKDSILRAQGLAARLASKK